MAHSEEPHSLPETDEEGGPVKTFLEHLEDLRWVFIKGGSVLVVGMIVCLLAAPQIFELLKRPLLEAKLHKPREGVTEVAEAGGAAGEIGGRPKQQINLELFGPLGGFMSSLKVSFYAGLVAGLPFILYFVGQFVVPALKAKEKKYFYTAFGVGTGFFMLGVVVCYLWLLPLSLKALVQYNTYLGFNTEVWRAEEFFEFVTKFLLGVGLLFEVPVLILTMVKLELITHEFLVRSRRYMFAVNLVFCMVITPADIVTTFMMALGLQICFEACILISKFWEKQKRAAEASLAPT